MSQVKHQTEIVAFKKLSNGQFSLCLRCCGNPSTDSWHTVAASVMASPKKRKESIKFAKERVAKEHENVVKAEEAVEKGDLE